MLRVCCSVITILTLFVIIALNLGFISEQDKRMCRGPGSHQDLFLTTLHPQVKAMAWVWGRMESPCEVLGACEGLCSACKCPCTQVCVTEINK